MRFLVVLLALTLPAFAQIRYSPTGFTAPFISTVTNQASAQAYLGISGGGGGSVTNFGGTATNLQVYSSGTTNRPLRVYGTNGSDAVYVGVDAELVVPTTIQSAGSFLLQSGGSVFYRGNASGIWYEQLNSQGLLLPNNAYMGFGTVFGSLNSAFYRVSDGLIEVNNGTAGQYRDLKLRTLYGEGGTVTASQPVLDISQTWNNAGVNFTAAKVNVTNTASGSGSKLQDWQVGGTTKGALDKNGNLSVAGTLTFGGTPTFSWNGSEVSLGNNFTLLGSFAVEDASANIRMGPWPYTAGLGYSASGKLEVNNGTVGQYRDLVTRSTFATNASITNITADSYVTTQQTLAYASGTNVTVDANKSLHFVSLTNTAYLAQPSNLGVGRSFSIILKQDGTGTRAVTFNTNYWKFPGGVVPTITTNANAYDVLSCISCPYGTNVFVVHNANFR